MMGSKAHIIGVGHTRFGRLEGRDAIDIMSQAAGCALEDAGRAPADVDGLICGYATTLPHLMIADLFAERFGLKPAYAHGVQAGGATGAMMVALAADLVRSGRCRSILVVAGENRLSGQTRDQSIQSLAQVGDLETEVRNGTSVPAYYALLASRYMYETQTSSEDLAELAVLMRRNAARHPQAHLREPLTLEAVLGSKPVASPLRLLDCCPISDGGVAFLVSADANRRSVEIIGSGQAHRHQHITTLADIYDVGAARSARAALAGADLTLHDIDYLGVYDSFTITLAILLEELGIVARGGTGRAVRSGLFEPDGRWPLNLHGGLMSFGHSGVAGGMMHLAEAMRQIRGEAEARQTKSATRALVHADGGVMSAHVSLVVGSAS